MEKIDLIKDLIKKAEKLDFPTEREVSLFISEAKILAETFFGQDSKYFKVLDFIPSLRLKKSFPKLPIRKSKREQKNIHHRVLLDLLFSKKIYDAVHYLKLMITDIKVGLVSEESEDFQKAKSENISEAFIKIDFRDYDLPHYNSLIELINESACSNKLYVWIPFYLRCLCENLLYDIFLKSLDNSHKSLYYQHRRRGFSQLISLLNILKDDEFKQYHTIDQDIITILKEIQKKGNLTVHEIIRQIDKKFIEDWKDKIDRILINLVILYKKVQSANIKIDDEKRLLKIKKVLRIEVRDIIIGDTDIEKVAQPKIKKDMIKNQFIRLHAILSKEVQSTKGELITLIREIGKNNFNKLLNLDLIEGGKILQLINENWEVRVFGPTELKPYSFFIRKPKLKENNFYRDNRDDPGNSEIHDQFLNYLTAKLGINENTERVDEKVEDKKGKKPKIHINETEILTALKKTENEFDEKILAEKMKSDLEMRIIVYPLTNKEELFNRSQFAEIEGYLDKKTQNGPFIGSFPTQMFGDIEYSRDGLFFISKTPMIGSILIQRHGVIFYNWSYGMRKDPDRETLPVDYMSAYLLGFFNLILKFYNKVNYLDDVKIIIKIRNIVNWKYSPHTAFILERPKYEFKHKGFSPIEEIYNIAEFSKKELIYKTVKEIFDEILLCYGIDKEFKLQDNFYSFL